MELDAMRTRSLTFGRGAAGIYFGEVWAWGNKAFSLIAPDVAFLPM
jgi:hypothetical protein